MPISDLIGRVSAGEHLTLDEMSTAMDAIMSGSVPEGEIAVFLTALHVKGETVDEVAGAAMAMRRHMTCVRTRHTDHVDTCGAGGVGSDLFNISTAAALVVAGAGVPVAKHGNRAVTSRSGSADVLVELGVSLEAEGEVVERCLEELGVCFCFAPRMHPAMRHVAQVRRRLGIATIFNLLGPLTNPAGAPFQVVGVGRDPLRPLLAEALVKLGTRRSFVVTGEDGLGEVSLAGATDVVEATPSGTRAFRWEPRDFGLSPARLDALRVGSPAQSAAIIRRVLGGEPGPERDIVVINAAAALLVAGKGADPLECARLAGRAIDSGAAAEKLRRLVEMTAA